MDLKERREQCKKDIAVLQNELVEIDKKITRTSERQPKTGDVLFYPGGTIPNGSIRLVIRCANGNLMTYGLISTGVSFTDTIRANLRSGIYKFLYNVFDEQNETNPNDR